MLNLEERFKTPKVRVVALTLVSKAGKELLVSQGIKNGEVKAFYRPLGGGVEHGERTIETANREMQEEIGQSLKNLEFLECIENIFQVGEETRHEIIFLYRGEFVNENAYETSSFVIDEPYFKEPQYAVWRSIEDMKSGEITVYPEEIIKWL